MSSVEPSSSVPIACSRNLTLSCARRRRWISAMYALALGSGRPSAITVRSAVAMASVRVLVLAPGAGLLGLGVRRSLEQERVVRRDERIRCHHRVRVGDASVLAREGDEAR